MNTLWEMVKSARLSRKQAEVVIEIAIATREADDYAKRLTARLIDNMYRLCKDNGIVFIILDIPQPNELREFKSSIPDGLIDNFERSSDALVRSEEVGSEYQHLTEFYAPHGQHDISELTHMLLGVAVAQRIERLAPPPNNVAEVSPTAPPKGLSEAH